MQKQLFLLMLGLSTMGGVAIHPTPAMALEAPAPNITVKGQVVDDMGEPLTGATIKVKGTATGTITDLDGNFELSVDPNATLEVSYVGFQNQDVQVNGRTSLPTIKMASDSEILEQVVVVGYGTQKKADLTGSVAIVNAEEMKKTSNSNISTMLEGKVPGVQITSDGQPGADPAVRIRGIGSFGSTAPLYIIDGVPVGTTIRDFSPNDIETIQVLKDAAAGAIYGSRAANGVVIITTKGGKKDQPLKVDYKGYFGFDKISSGVYDVMDANQYSNYLGQACLNSNTPLAGGYKLNADTGRYQFQDATNTDWFTIDGEAKVVTAPFRGRTTGGEKSARFYGSHDLHNGAFEICDGYVTIRQEANTYERREETTGYDQIQMYSNYGTLLSYTGTSTSDTVYSLGYDQIADLSSANFEFTWTFKQTSYGGDVCLGLYVQHIRARVGKQAHTGQNSYV